MENWNLIINKLKKDFKFDTTKTEYEFFEKKIDGITHIISSLKINNIGELETYLEELNVIADKIKNFKFDCTESTQFEYIPHNDN